MWFDFSACGQLEPWAWTDPTGDDGWLVLDRNGNAIIDNGAELFGSATWQPEPPEGEVRNGFLALGVFDEAGNGGNGDGFIDAQDATYANLRLWHDKNQNGTSEADELKTLPDANIGRIDLVYKEKKQVDDYGNAFRFRARIWDLEGKRLGWAWDVFLVSNE